MHPSVSASHIHPTRILPESITIAFHIRESRRRLRVDFTCSQAQWPLAVNPHTLSHLVSLPFHLTWSWLMWSRVDPHSQPPSAYFTASLCSSTRLPVSDAVRHCSPLSGGVLKESYHCDRSLAFYYRRHNLYDSTYILYVNAVRLLHSIIPQNGRDSSLCSNFYRDFRILLTSMILHVHRLVLDAAVDRVLYLPGIIRPVFLLHQYS